MTRDELENITTLRSLLGDTRVLDEMLRWLYEDDIEEFVRNLILDYDLEIYLDESEKENYD